MATTEALARAQAAREAVEAAMQLQKEALDQRREAIKALRAEGMTYQAIADIVGVSMPRVERIANDGAPFKSKRKKPGWPAMHIAPVKYIDL